MCKVLVIIKSLHSSSFSFCLQKFTKLQMIKHSTISIDHLHLFVSISAIMLIGTEKYSIYVIVILFTIFNLCANSLVVIMIEKPADFNTYHIVHLSQCLCAKEIVLEEGISHFPLPGSSPDNILLFLLKIQFYLLIFNQSKLNKLQKRY